MPTGKSPRMSRRQLIAGGVAGAGTVAVAGCAPDPFDGVQADEIYAARIDTVPVDDPDAANWGRTPEKTVVMGPQNIALPQRLEPAVPSIKVRAVHDGRMVAFRIEWDDAEADDLTVRVDDFRDACAVLLAGGSGDIALRTMGTATTPATLLHWKADWQRDLDQGVQGVAAVYPNVSVDVYPPLWDSQPGEVDVATYERAGATEWLPGVHVGNPTSAPTRSSAVEKIVAYGFSTSTTAGHQDARGRGVRHGAGWRVVIAKPLTPTEESEHRLVAGGSTATCAFAVWSGAAGDAGSRKTPSAGVYRLVLEA